MFRKGFKLTIDQVKNSRVQLDLVAKSLKGTSPDLLIPITLEDIQEAKAEFDAASSTLAELAVEAAKPDAKFTPLAPERNGELGSTNTRKALVFPGTGYYSTPHTQKPLFSSAGGRPVFGSKTAGQSGKARDQTSGSRIRQQTEEEVGSLQPLKKIAEEEEGWLLYYLRKPDKKPEDSKKAEASKTRKDPRKPSDCCSECVSAKRENAEFVNNEIVLRKQVGAEVRFAHVRCIDPTRLTFQVPRLIKIDPRGLSRTLFLVLMDEMPSQAYDRAEVTKAPTRIMMATRASCSSGSSSFSSSFSAGSKRSDGSGGKAKKTKNMVKLKR